MRNFVFLLFFSAYLIFNASLSASGEAEKHAKCAVCGMETEKYPLSRITIEYDDRTSAETCSIFCAAALISADRGKTVTNLLVSDFQTQKMIDAKKAFWVIGGKEKGVMTGNAKWAFESRADAAGFVKKNGGKISSYDEAMRRTFADMLKDIKMSHLKIESGSMGDSDIKAHPECKYCGMDRKKYAYSRTLAEYDDGAVTGLCSIHCAAIDLAMNINKKPERLLVADYYGNNIIDAGKAFWVLGGNRSAVMSIRGKWAFEKKEDAKKFIKENGGRLSSLNEIIKAAFVDMWEILR